MANRGQASLGMQMRSAVPMIKALKGELMFAGVGLVLGLIIGWFLLGWVIAPVQWTSGAPIDLQKSYRDFYLRTLSVALADKAVSLEELEKLGIGERWNIDDVLVDLNRLAKDPATGIRYRSLIDTLDALKRQRSQAQPATPAPATPIGSILLALIAVVVVAFISLQLVRRVSRSAQPQAAAGTRAVTPAGAAVVTGWVGETEAPLRQFDLTYMLGDDRFDLSNAIEAPDGSFLGECGTGISERIGVGNPDKVTALEVWVFDKNDIRTVTTVLMSENAYNDRATRDKLAAKGEPALATEGVVVMLETASLRVRALVAELQYGSAGLPPNSFFQKAHIVMAVWQIADGGVTQPAPKM